MMGFAVHLAGDEWAKLGDHTQTAPQALECSNSPVLQRFSGAARVTGIEPAFSAWEEFLSHRVLLCCNGFGGLA
jgi:hypothetical protein